MAESASFSFNDKALDREVRLSTLQFRNFQRLLDETSADMRNLEQMLRQCGICVAAFVDVEARNGLPLIRLGWDRDANTNAWRLVVHQLDEDSPFGQEPEYFCRPVLEATAKIRAACKPALVQLVRELRGMMPSVDENLPPKSEKTNEVEHEEEPDLFSVFEDEEVYGERQAPAEELDMIFANDDEIPF